MIVMHIKYTWYSVFNVKVLIVVESVIDHCKSLLMQKTYLNWSKGFKWQSFGILY